jgi:hypothetical protein
LRDIRSALESRIARAKACFTFCVRGPWRMVNMRKKERKEDSSKDARLNPSELLGSRGMQWKNSSPSSRGWSSGSRNSSSIVTVKAFLVSPLSHYDIRNLNQTRRWAIQERTHGIMQRDGSLLWCNQITLNEELVFTFRIRWQFLFHCLKHHFEHVGLAHRVEYYKRYCTLYSIRLTRVHFSGVGQCAVQLWI